jgi:hypothetical protein
MDEEKGYEVVDKRKTSSEGEDQQEAVTGEEQASQAFESPDVYAIIGMTVMMLAQNCWHWMGLQVNPSTGKLEKDLTQAKIAIDTIVFLTDKVASHISEEDLKAFRVMISDLQINFVQQMNKQE